MGTVLNGTGGVRIVNMGRKIGKNSGKGFGRHWTAGNIGAIFSLDIGAFSYSSSLFMALGGTVAWQMHERFGTGMKGHFGWVIGGVSIERG